MPKDRPVSDAKYKLEEGGKKGCQNECDFKYQLPKELWNNLILSVSGVRLAAVIRCRTS